jgi:hypothetical protein
MVLSIYLHQKNFRKFMMSLCNATYNDGSCEFITHVCADSNAYNYNHNGIHSPDLCKYIGCMDSMNIHFNPTATLNAYCIQVFGCSNSMAINYNPSTINSGNCILKGCMNKTNAFYNPTAYARGRM